MLSTPPWRRLVSGVGGRSGSWRLGLHAWLQQPTGAPFCFQPTDPGRRARPPGPTPTPFRGVPAPIFRVNRPTAKSLPKTCSRTRRGSTSTVPAMGSRAPDHFGEKGRGIRLALMTSMDMLTLAPHCSGQAGDCEQDSSSAGSLEKSEPGRCAATCRPFWSTFCDQRRSLAGKGCGVESGAGLTWEAVGRLELGSPAPVSWSVRRRSRRLSW